MAIICPTITAENPHIYREQLERATKLSKRIHFDIADGVLAPNVLIKPIQLYWDEDIIADVHVMYQKPAEQLATLIALKPQLIIFHVESDGDIASLCREVQSVGIKAGISLLQDTKVEDYVELIKLVDHVLIFSGNFGHFGGQADLSLLPRVELIKQANPGVEVAWDGGINKDNAKQLVEAGVEVLNVGGSIHLSSDPEMAFDELSQALW